MQRLTAARVRRAAAALAAAGLAAMAAAAGDVATAAPVPPQAEVARPPLAPPPHIHVTTTASVERKVEVDGRAEMRLAPADHVVAGDTVVYTLAVRNDGPDPATGVVVTTPVPARMRYLPASAVGPGVAIAFSVDGGRSYDTPQRLHLAGADGKPRRAVAADYTNIRWTLQDVLHAGSVAFLRYRAALR